MCSDRGVAWRGLLAGGDRAGVEARPGFDQSGVVTKRNRRAVFGEDGPGAGRAAAERATAGEEVRPAGDSRAICRKSRFTRRKKVRNKTADHVRRQFRTVLSSVPSTHRRSTTFDNGSEFARCHLAEKTHGTKRDSAEPGCPHQRGTNENTNSLLRQDFLKGTDFTTVTWAERQRVETLLNNRPRRCLGYRTPNEVFREQSAISNCN